jgi:hypothetical protein
LFGHRNLDLSVFARRAENANAIDFAFWSDDRELFLAGVLTGLGEIGVFGQLMALAEQGFNVFLSQMNVMR